MPEPITQKQIAREARALFVEYFAKAYREGHDPLIGPVRGTREQQQRAIMAHEYLVRRGLTVRTNSARFFRLSDRGKELALQADGVDQALGIESDVAPVTAVEHQFDPTAVREHAKRVFEEYFRSCDRALNVIPREDGELAACRELARKGLARESRHGGAFLIGPRGIEVCMGEADLDQELGLKPPPSELPPAPHIVNNFHAPVGAVAAAAGAMAYGSVNVQQVDEAMRRTIERQDELGALADVLLPLLRKVRKQQIEASSEAELIAAVTAADEFRDFERAVKPGLTRAALSAAKAVLEVAPVLKPALELMGG